MLLTISSKGNRVLHPDAAKLCPELERLTEDELLLICLAYDYYSPMRQLSEIERRRRAWAQVFRDKKKDPFETPKIKDAVSFYCSLQYDERREQVKTYLNKISTINEAIRDADSPATITNLVKINAELRKSVNAIEEELLQSEERDSVTVKGQGKLSLLESLMRNREKYETVIRNREKFKSVNMEEET